MISASRFFGAVVGAICLLSSHSANAEGRQETSDITAAVREYRVANEHRILDEFMQMLALPNITADVSNIERNARFIQAALERRGLTTRLLSAAPGTPPAIYAELLTPGASRTIIFYAHYDGQPAGQSGWISDPFTPVVRTSAAEQHAIDWRQAKTIDPEWRIYARSASDDKAPIQAILTALDALSAAGRQPSVNLKFFFEGEEEAGSPNLSRILERYRTLLSGDLFIFGDGPGHASGSPQITFGARGLATLDITTFGPLRPLHSGHYGNWARNPGIALTHVLATMRDEDGKILIPGFYDDVRELTSVERESIAVLPHMDRELRRELALARSEGAGRLEERIARPALNLRGIRMGEVGAGATNTIWTRATASFDFRLVPDQQPEQVRGLVERHFASLGWQIVHHEPTPDERAKNHRLVKLEWNLGYPAYRADLNSTAAQAVASSITRSTGERPLMSPMMGGSVPLHWFAQALDIPIITLPIANHDNNQHAANENIRVRNLWSGIEIYAGLIGDLNW